MVLTCEALNVHLVVRRSATAIVGVLCKYCYMQDNSAFVVYSFHALYLALMMWALQTLLK